MNPILAAVRKKMQRAVTEDTVEKHLVRQVEARHGVAVKMLFLTGWPDRMVLLPGGIIFFVELKRPVGGRDEPLQPRVQLMLRRLGFLVYKLNTKQQVNEVLRAY